MDAVGYVYDKADNSPLPGVNIAVRNTQGQMTGQGTTTDSRGFFNLTNIPAGYGVEFRFIGYRTQMPLLRDFNNGLSTVYLERTTYDQPEVTIVGQQSITPASVKKMNIDTIMIALAILMVAYIGYQLTIGK